MSDCSRTSSTTAQLSMLLALFNGVLVYVIMPTAATAEQPIRIVALGDSLTAGFMLPASQAFSTQLKRALNAKGYDVEVIDAGVSGDTTAAALERFEWAVPDGVDAAIVELGANDALRGLDPALARRNLESIITRLKAKGAEILIAGMIAPRNWGQEYAQQFDAIFPDLAKTHGTLLYPFFLEGVALRQELNLDDGLHPNAKGVAEIIERILPSVEELIRRAAAKRKG
ncbi:MAG TPA: arylesterase [Hyphomicrobiaceae bacterium]|nr:arylesterase [Hyphomicrobiaceae bacterium]